MKSYISYAQLLSRPEQINFLSDSKYCHSPPYRADMARLFRTLLHLIVDVVTVEFVLANIDTKY